MFSFKSKKDKQEIKPDENALSFAAINYYLSVCLTSVISYFLVGVFGIYSISIFLFFAYLLHGEKQGFRSKFSISLLILFLASFVIINPHNYIHTLVILITTIIYLLNKRISSLLPQNIFCTTLIILIFFNPGVLLIIFSNYHRFLTYILGSIS